MRRFIIFTSCLSLLVALVGCTATPKTSLVAVLVEIPRPAAIADEQITSAFVESVQEFRAVAGLQRKYFTFSDDVFGGVYLWDSRSDAVTFFSDEWHTRIQDTYGESAKLTWFEVVEKQPSAAHEKAGRDGVVSVVRISAPWYAPNGMIRDRMAQALPEYANIAGLDYKYFTIATGRKLGGIYLWEDAEAAQRFYSDTWHQRIQERYGEAADLKFYSAPVTVLDGKSQLH